MHVDRLERRVLLSAALDAATRMLVITGGRGSDAIVCSIRRQKLRVTVNGVLQWSSRLRGLAGLEILPGRRNDAVTIAGNVPLRASVIGGSGNDTLVGGGHDDTLVGNTGDDVINGGGGDDELRGGDGRDKLYGDDGAGALFPSDNDRLYGEGDADLLEGGGGRDGLFGGIDHADTLVGGPGDDRFLLPERRNRDRSEDTANWSKADGDARIWFDGWYGAHRTVEWTDEEVQAVDTGLHILHLRMNGTQLLRPAAGVWPELNHGEQMFSRDPTLTSSSAVTNGTGFVNMGDSAFSSASWTKHVVVHEIGHNWDSKWGNPWWEKGHDFEALSGWVARDPDAPAPAGMLLSGDGKWFYRETASFHSPYSRTNPREDFAEHFLYFLLGNRPQGDLGLKWDFMSGLVNELNANPQPYVE